MAEDYPILRRHRLAHIPTLQVDPALFTKRFSAGCQTSNCSAACCNGGVWVDVEERNRVLANADRVQKMMDPGQDQDPAHWFETEEQADPDCPSGLAVGTQVFNDRCVFLDAANRCALQRASTETNGALQLKPFFCRLYPITLSYGVLTFDDETAESQTDCCGVRAEGQSSIFDVCREELNLIVDPQGLHELQRLADG